eukprot:71187_1
MAGYVFLRCILLFLITPSLCERFDRNGTVYYNQNVYQISANQIACHDANAIACGYFNNSLNETGWNILEIKTTKQNNDLTDYDRMYAAGMLEGWLTPFEIYYQWTNIWNEKRATYEPYLDQLKNWTTIQRQWTIEQISVHNSPEDPEYEYWQYMNLIWAQFDGVQKGYNTAVYEDDINLPTLDSFVFWFLNSIEEFHDLLHVFDPNKFNVNWTNLTDDEYMRYTLETGSCSGLVKVTPTYDDIYFAHSTWTDYYKMNRIYKYYKFDLELNTATSHLSMASYPAVLSSIDDWYLLDSGLAVMETTNHIFNDSLWSYVSPQSLFTWQRTIIANALSKSGKEWVEMFSMYNSGTYNNQWIVLNHNLFTPKQPLQDGLLWVLEQIPGHCSYRDETQILERGYWASYNVAALPDIYIESGTAQQAQIHGAAASYDLAPRARIFRRDANNANNFTTIEKLMRYNDYQHDKIQNGDPCWAIMCRHDLDLNHTRAIPNGGTDTKAANLYMLQNMFAMVQSGPTHDDVPVFKWSQFSNISHLRLPAAYDFQWTTVQSVL